MKNIKRLLSTILALVLLLSIIPIYAQEMQSYDISQWAVAELVDAERFGIFYDEWYTKDFKSGFSKERLDVLLLNTREKVESIELEKNPNFKEVEIKDELTREGVLKSLYNIVSPYDKNYDKDMEPIDYLYDLGILKGDSLGLSLKRKATTEEAVLFAKRFINKIYNNVDGGAKGLMWKVENNGNTVYMLGSIHMADSSIYPMSKKIMDAFNSSDELLVELDLLNPASTQSMLEKMYYTDGRTLESEINQELYEEVKTIMSKYGVQEPVYKYMKPWAVILQLSSLSMLSDDPAGAVKHGIDMYFLINAKTMDKKIVELEGMDFQVDLFNDLEIEKQRLLLEETVDSLINLKPEETDTPKEALEEMLSTWKNGDEKEFIKIFTSTEDSSELNKLLLGQRDINMAEKISKILENKEGKTYFVVVGAAHYVSEGGIVDILMEKGYSVENLNNN